MRVLLFGSTGNLGARCVPALLAHDHTLTVYVRDLSKLKSMMSPAIIERLESIVVGDATDAAAIERAIREHAIEAIINVAGNQVLPWNEYTLPKIAKAVSDAAIAVGKERGVPMRIWFTASVQLLKIPGLSYMIQDLAPFKSLTMAQHEATRQVIEPISLTELRWSLLCVSRMTPLDPKQGIFELLDTPRPHNLLLGANTLPSWIDSWVNSIPVIGKYINIWVVILSQYYTTLESPADFLAEDLEKGSGEFVGKFVGMKEKPKSKDN
ncbi:hypothetical protein LSUE1_G008225 [Lachnellula suecica]|uniref:NAD(P)-binding domain-containing protein n=1 Tax=Lachnellula suecica TaxID=602035 RepID=A0A8T9CA59_9HELO|nr:hypothetical protein LSUE1_G008225 [Lachnellula suecica]